MKKIVIVEDKNKKNELFKAVLGMILKLEILAEDNGKDSLESI